MFLFTVAKYLLKINNIKFLQHLKYYMLFSSIRQNIQVLCNRRQDLDLYIAKADKYLPYGEYSKNVSLRRSIVLKQPIIIENCVIEKGVLLISFTNSFEYFIRHVNLDKLLLHYYVVLEPSWSGYCDLRILYWMKFNRHKILIEATETEDYKFLEMLESNLKPVDFGASDWVDDRMFYPIEETQKKYDIVYVAAFGTYKRHHVLFKAVKELGDPSLHVALVGISLPSERLEIDVLIEHYGIRDNVKIFQNLKQKKVNEILNASKVNVLLSLREGSNRSIFEGLFAGIPAIVLKENIGVQKKYINEMTGMLIDEKDLVSAIRHFRKNWRDYKPDTWARKNISPSVTTNKLNIKLREIAKSRNEQWTKDIVKKVNSPEVEYYHESDKEIFSQCMQDVENNYYNNPTITREE